MSRVYAKLYSLSEVTEKNPFHLIKALYMTKLVFSALLMHKNINWESFDESSNLKLLFQLLQLTNRWCYSNTRTLLMLLFVKDHP